MLVVLVGDLRVTQCDFGVNLLGHPLIGRLWHFVNTHENAPAQKTAETSAFIEVLTC